MIGIFLENQDHFHSNIPILGGFHTAIRLEYYMGKYIQESWLEESLKKNLRIWSESCSILWNLWN